MKHNGVITPQGALRIYNRPLFEEEVRAMSRETDLAVTIEVKLKRRFRSDVQNAYYWGVVIAMISQRLRELGHDVDRDLTTSNGTPCDQFYEVMDALSINPVAMREVTEAVDYQVDSYLEQHPAPTFSGSPFAESLTAPLGLRIPELGVVVEGMRDRVVTLLDVPTFYVLSAPKDSVSDSSLRRLTANILKYVQSQIDIVEDADQVNPTLEKLLAYSFENFQGNWEAYRAIAGETFGRRARTVLRPLSQFLRAHHMNDLSREVERFENFLRA
jgi:hypothetical protein